MYLLIGGLLLFMLTGQPLAQLEARMRDFMSAGQVAPEQIKKDRVEYVDDVLVWLKKNNDQLLRRHHDLRKARLMKSLRSALYHLGHQVITAKGNFGYNIHRLNGSDHPIEVMNKIRPYNNEVTALWVQSNPEVQFAVLIEDDRQRVKTLDAIRDLNDHFNILHLNEKFLLNCAQFGQFDGNYCAEIYFDKDSRNGLQWYEEYQTQDIPEEMWGRCYACGSIGPIPTMTCLSCGSPDLEQVPLQAAQVETQKSADWQKSGEVDCKFSRSWNHHFSYTTGPGLSPWRYHEEDWAREAAEHKFGKLDGTANDSAWQADELMHPDRVMRRAERQSNTASIGSDYGDTDDCVLIQRFWRNPEMLHYIAGTKDTKLPNGEVVPARVRWSEYFSKGLCTLTAPGTASFIDMYPEMHAERFIDGIFGVSPGQEIGHGNDDAPVAQKQYNLLHSGEYHYIQRTFHPSIVAKRNAFKGENLRLFNRPDGVLQYKGDEDVRTLFSVVQAPELSSRIPLLKESLDAMLQAQTGAQNSQGDYPGVNNPTATAAKIGLAKTTTKAALHLILYAGFIKEIRLRTLTLAQNNYDSLRLIQSTDPLSAQRRAKVLDSADLRYSVMAYVKEGSYLPDLQEVKRANFVAAAEVRTKMQAAGIASPALDKQIDELFQTDFAKEHRSERQYQCEDEFDEMREALPVAMMMPNLQMGAMYLMSLRPTEVEEKGHEQKADWWRDLLGSPEGRQLPPVLREAIKLKIYAEAHAEMLNREFIAYAAQIGAGLLAPPLSTGLGPQDAAKLPAMPPQAMNEETDGKEAQANRAAQKKDANQLAPSL